MILCFHEISYEKNEYIVSPEQFRYLIKKFPNAQIHFDDGRAGVLRYGLPILKALNKKATLFLVPSFLFGNVPKSELYSSFLKIDDIKYFLKENWEIGSHSYNHQNLTTLPRELIIEELQLSKEFLQNITHRKVISFAFPFGAVNEEVLSLAKKFYKFTYALDKPFGIKRKLILNTSTS